MGRTREGSRYEPLLRGEDEEEEERDVDTHVIGDDGEEEVRRRSGSVQCRQG